MLPARDVLPTCFAHAVYRMQDRFALRNTGIRSIEVRDRAALDAGVRGAEVLIVSGLWNDALIPRAPKLRFVQSISAGVDQYGRGPASPPDAGAAARARAAAADRTAHRLLLEVERLRGEGVASLQGLARGLTARGVPSPRGGGVWTHTTVARLLARVGA